jgi:hypothetical protein
MYRSLGLQPDITTVHVSFDLISILSGLVLSTFYVYVIAIRAHPYMYRYATITERTTSLPKYRNKVKYM